MAIRTYYACPKYYTHPRAEEMRVRSEFFVRRGPAIYDNLRYRGGYALNEFVVIALDGDKLAGVWYFDYEHGGLCSAGTWVEKAYRKQGIAQKMWRRGIKETRPTYIDGHAATSRGYSLLEKIQEDYPNIDVQFDRMHSKVRSLRKKNGRK